MTLAAGEFIRRFLLHILPEGFHRIRYYGFLGNRHRAQKLARCRELLGATVSEPAHRQAQQDYRDRCEKLTGDSLTQCPVCRQGRMITIKTIDGTTDTAGAPGHVMMAARFQPCRLGPICLAQPATGTALPPWFAHPADALPVLAPLLETRRR
jgi:Putative transposase